jgi:hypothetical protein
MKRNNFVLLAVFVFLVSCLTLYPESDRKKIDRLMNSYYKNGQFNGTILVKKDNATLYQ